MHERSGTDLDGPADDARRRSTASSRTCLAKDPEDRWQTRARRRERAPVDRGGGRRPDSRTADRSPAEPRAARVGLGGRCALRPRRPRRRPFQQKPSRTALESIPRSSSGPDNLGMGPAAPLAALSPDGRILAFTATTSECTQPLGSSARLARCPDAGRNGRRVLSLLVARQSLPRVLRAGKAKEGRRLGWSPTGAVRGASR